VLQLRGKLVLCIRFHKKEDIMQQDEQEDKTIYKVVVNHEEQYSIWPVDRENALGGPMRARAALRKSVWRISRRFGPICAR
jgi:uncharacterized protein YbdZ (MbtH family)